jgi:hypothetical protein
MATLASMYNSSGARTIPLADGRRVRLTPREQQAVLQEVWQTYFPHIGSYALALSAIEREPASATYIAETAAAYTVRRAATPAPAAPPLPPWPTASHARRTRRISSH